MSNRRIWSRFAYPLKVQSKSNAGTSSTGRKRCDHVMSSDAPVAHLTPRAFT